MPSCKRKVLLLSVGYGEGHHSAARALAEEFARGGWQTEMIDSCQRANPVLFPLTQRFYHYCVRSMPWLWRVTYAQTETADWARLIHFPGLRRCMTYLREKLQGWSPDLVVCTYPLFAYMMDEFRREGWWKAPCVLVVTDALEISRPWMLTETPLVCLTDEYSLSLVRERYAPAPGRLAATGFPVRSAFHEPEGGRPLPDRNHLRVVYGAYAPVPRVVADVRLLLQLCPGARITLLAGERREKLCRLLPDELRGGRLSILTRSDDMPGLFRDCHLYIGKAGAATLFEAYASVVPVVVNYALPGQEQGNLELLQRDGAGSYAEETAELGAQVEQLLADGARRWLARCEAIRASQRSGGASRIVELVEKTFFEGKNS